MTLLQPGSLLDGGAVRVNGFEIGIHRLRNQIIYLIVPPVVTPEASGYRAVRHDVISPQGQKRCAAALRGGPAVRSVCPICKRRFIRRRRALYQHIAASHIGKFLPPGLPLGISRENIGAGDVDHVPVFRHLIDLSPLIQFLRQQKLHPVAPLSSHGNFHHTGHVLAEIVEVSLLLAGNQLCLADFFYHNRRLALGCQPSLRPLHLNGRRPCSVVKEDIVPSHRILSGVIDFASIYVCQQTGALPHFP